MAKYPGKKIMIGDKEWIVPALSLGQLRNGVMDKFKEHDELIRQRDGGDDDPTLTWKAALLREDVTRLALSRNYSEEELKELELDLASLPLFWDAVLGRSGLDEIPEAGTDPNSPPSTSGVSITS